MSDQCANCGKAITEGSTWKSPNSRISAKRLEWVNRISGTEYADLCDVCCGKPIEETHAILTKEIAQRTDYFQRNITAFPMFTISWLPADAKVQFKNLVTANISVGTGMFNELSQGISDLFGAVNSNSGMSLKVNQGEAAARAILVDKALKLGANCVVGVDLDYGTTVNNAATVNMQGTAAVVANLEAMMSKEDIDRAAGLREAFDHLVQLRRWSNGDLGEWVKD